MKREPGQLTKERRLREIAAIFARGMLRYHKNLREKTSQTQEKEAAKSLEVPGETRLSVSRVSC